MERYLIHSNEIHLISEQKIREAVEQMVESLGMAAGSTTNFDIYKVVETYFKDLEKRREFNRILGIDVNEEELEEDFGSK